MINGRLYDWEDVNVVLPSGEAIGISEINYNDELPLKKRYGKGATPRGYGRGNYDASGNLSLDLDEAERLRKSLGGSFYKGGAFNIVVNYANENQGIVTDTLRDCKFVKTDTSNKQGEDNAGARKLDFEIMSPIELGGEPAY